MWNDRFRNSDKRHTLPPLGGLSYLNTLSVKTCPQVEPKIFHECKAQAGDFFMFSTAKAKVYLSVGTVEV